MENAVDALKMAFGVFAFILALSIALISLSRVKETADAVLWNADKTNYYSWAEGTDQSAGRKVGKDTIIASLYRKQADTYVIVIIGNTKYVFNCTTGVVAEVNRTTNTLIRPIIDTNEVANMGYLINFINTKLDANKTYYENVSEVTNQGMLGGEYIVAEDGTKLQITQGDSKVIVTYTQI